MNLDPRRSRNFDKSIEKTKRMNQGSRHKVGGKRLTVKEIAEIIGKRINTTGDLLRTYTAEKLIAKEEKIKQIKFANLSKQEP